MISYRTSLAGVTQENLTGFFVGWPAAPSPAQHLAALRGSHRVVLAWEDDRVVGFVNAISDGTLTAFVPWLEVLPPHQGRGIGSTLIRTLLESLDELYSVDLVCDEELRGFYTHLGFRPLLGMGHRNRNTLS